MSKGYKKLIADVKRDCEESEGIFHSEGCCKCGGKCAHRYCDKFKWAINRAKTYDELQEIRKKLRNVKKINESL